MRKQWVPGSLVCLCKILEPGDEARQCICDASAVIYHPIKNWCTVSYWIVGIMNGTIQSGIHLGVNILRNFDPEK